MILRPLAAETFIQCGQRITVLAAQLSDMEECQQLGRIIAGVFNSAMQRRYYSSGYTEPIAFIADEAHSLKETVDFEQSTALLREAKVAMLIGTQSLTQFNTEKKRDRGQRIAGRCGTVIALPGVDYETAEWLSNSLGDRTDASSTVGRQINSRTYNADSSRRTRMLGTREIQERSPDMRWTALVKAMGGKPFFCCY